MEDFVYLIAGIVPLVGGVYVGRRRGILTGVAVGVGLFAAAVGILVAAGYGY